ncbi:unnamed protein product [Calypogeia fissa]
MMASRFLSSKLRLLSPLLALLLFTCNQVHGLAVPINCTTTDDDPTTKDVESCYVKVSRNPRPVGLIVCPEYCVLNDDICDVLCTVGTATVRLCTKCKLCKPIIDIEPTLKDFIEECSKKSKTGHIGGSVTVDITSGVHAQLQISRTRRGTPDS